MSDAYSYLARYYDRLTCDVPYDRFADFYEEIFRRSGISPHTVLDLACGTGTLTRILADRGYDVTAADASPEMLSIAADKLSGLANPVLLLCQDMDMLDLNDTVDAALCSLDGINYVEPENLQAVFDRVHLFLSPGGLFIFDINTPYKLRSLDGELFIDEDDDVFCTWRADFDEDENCCVYGFDVFAREGDVWRRFSEEHVEYVYCRGQMVSMLESAGFVDIGVFAELSFDAPAEDEQRVFVTARKPYAGLGGGVR